MVDRGLTQVTPQKRISFYFMYLQKLNEEALAHATMQYNIQLSQLKTENAVLISNLEKERNSKEKTESEVIDGYFKTIGLLLSVLLLLSHSVQLFRVFLQIKSLQIRLDTTIVELEKAQAARSELER